MEEVLHTLTQKPERGWRRRRDVVERSSTVLAGGRYDLHHLLQHLRESRPQLPQGALQDRGPLPREGSLLRRQVGRRQAREAHYSNGSTRMRGELPKWPCLWVRRAFSHFFSLSIWEMWLQDHCEGFTVYKRGFTEENDGRRQIRLTRFSSVKRLFYSLKIVKVKEARVGTLLGVVSRGNPYMGC